MLLSAGARPQGAPVLSSRAAERVAHARRGAARARRRARGRRSCGAPRRRGADPRHPAPARRAASWTARPAPLSSSAASAPRATASGTRRPAAVGEYGGGTELAAGRQRRLQQLLAAVHGEQHDREREPEPREAGGPLTARRLARAIQCRQQLGGRERQQEAGEPARERAGSHGRGRRAPLPRGHRTRSGSAARGARARRWRSPRRAALSAWRAASGAGVWQRAPLGVHRPATPRSPNCHEFRRAPGRH